VAAMRIFLFVNWSLSVINKSFLDKKRDEICDDIKAATGDIETFAN
jgi:hypothetical protein